MHDGLVQRQARADADQVHTFEERLGESPRVQLAGVVLCAGRIGARVRRPDGAAYQAALMMFLMMLKSRCVEDI